MKFKIVNKEKYEELVATNDRLVEKTALLQRQINSKDKSFEIAKKVYESQIDELRNENDRLNENIKKLYKKSKSVTPEKTKEPKAKKTTTDKPKKETKAKTTKKRAKKETVNAK